MLEVIPDERLLVEIAQRDEAALVELHRRYAPYLTAVARRMLRDKDDVHQCVQDAFVKVWEHAERFDPAKASVKTWLVTICHRLAINRLRGTTLEVFPLEEWDAPAPSHQADVLDKVVVESALATLDHEARALIELAFFAGYSHSQIAEHTGRPLGTIKSKLRHALQALRDQLAGGDS
jgi:RNA polymerase sigma-70 factor (ECF subfamily)